MPCYREATYGGETVTLENQHLRLEIHKRVTGWGWGELFVPGPSGKPEKFFAVLEHLAEADIVGYAHPLRLEASDYKLDRTDEGQTLTFEVELQQVEPPGQVFGGESALKGTVTLILPDDEAMIYYKLEAIPQFLMYLRSLRGIWLRVGANSFGIARHDAIFPGIDWVILDEWSSGTDWFEHPEALRVAPHPHKVAIPVMAISCDGVGIGLSWTPDQPALSSKTRIRCPQPVFATPNFVDRRSHHLLGLMLPSARWGLKENELKADPPIKVPRGTRLTLDAQLSVVNGTSLDVIMDWVKRNGMPDPGPPRYEWNDAMERIAKAYNSNLWIEGKGWGFRGQGAPHVPESVSHYIEHGTDPEMVSGLSEKAAWCQKQERPLIKPDVAHLRFGRYDDEHMLQVGNELLKIQTPEGDFPFDPDGRHKTNLLEWAALWRPLGLPGDSALDLCATAAGALILAGQKLGEQKFLDAARKTLEFAMKFERPEGGDWWETPLYSPNLLAAGDAAIAYCLGHNQFGDQRYLERARHWIRCVIPFTHLWEPMDVTMLYNTKPCLNSTSWFLSDWTAKHVQWEILTVFSMSDKLGIDWAEVDPEVDWRTYQKGVTTAVLRWMIDHDDTEWMFRSEFPPEAVENGAWDALFSDTFDPVSDTYGGGPIMPEVIAANILIVLKHR
jgi:hypothetical protein